MKPDSYPVRRRGERRRLQPNLEGIEWLERKTFENEIVATGTADGLTYFRAIGAPRYQHSRPMFQVIPRDAFSGMPTRIKAGCPACYDFTRSWSCEGHCVGSRFSFGVVFDGSYFDGNY